MGLYILLIALAVAVAAALGAGAIAFLLTGVLFLFVYGIPAFIIGRVISYIFKETITGKIIKVIVTGALCIIALVFAEQYLMHNPVYLLFQRLPMLKNVLTADAERMDSFSAIAMFISVIVGMYLSSAVENS